MKDLNNTQRDLELQFANKSSRSRRHTNFHQQKTKVKLVVQTLSNSVATTIQTLEEVGFEFEWKFYALLASKAIFRARTYSHIMLFSPVMMIT